MAKVRLKIKVRCCILTHPIAIQRFLLKIKYRWPSVLLTLWDQRITLFIIRSTRIIEYYKHFQNSLCVLPKVYFFLSKSKSIDLAEACGSTFPGAGQGFITCAQGMSVGTRVVLYVMLSLMIGVGFVLLASCVNPYFDIVLEVLA